MKKTTAIALLLALTAALPAFAQTRTANFGPGDTVFVVLKVNVRSAPNGEIAGTQGAGARGVLTGSPVVAGGYTWWNVNYDTGMDGWSAEDFMQQVSAPFAQTNIFSNSALAAGVGFATQSAQRQLAAGSSVTATANLNVRSTPGGAIIATVPGGTQGKISGGPQVSGGHTWWQVQYDAAAGWSAAEYLTLTQ